MTHRDRQRYRRLIGRCDRALVDIAILPVSELRGHMKRRATLAAKRLMQDSRALWALLAGISR